MKLHLLPVVVSLAALPLAAQTIPGSEELNKPCPAPCCGYDCADSCKNDNPFELTSCKTTPYGPARADIVIGSNALQSTNMLYCPGGTTEKPRPYALCFFSGPTSTTGVPNWQGAPKNVLTCTPDWQTGFANCQCQVYNTGAYYVLINSILNRGVFWQTHKVCGADGSLCKNIAACDNNGQQKTSCGAQPCPTCPDQIAPVCGYVGEQPYDTKNGLFPQLPHTSVSRVDLISTFSYAMGDLQSTGPYQLGSVSCTNGFYAGCMTAPCVFPEGSSKADGSIVNCSCPMWQGDYQIGQPAANLQQSQGCPASNAGWVWSAANAVAPPAKTN